MPLRHEPVENHLDLDKYRHLAARTRCSCRLSNCCDHFKEHGKHMDRVQAGHSAADYAAKPEQLMRAWARAAFALMLGGE